MPVTARICIIVIFLLVLVGPTACAQEPVCDWDCAVEGGWRDHSGLIQLNGTLELTGDNLLIVGDDASVLLRLDRLSEATINCANLLQGSNQRVRMLVERGELIPVAIVIYYPTTVGEYGQCAMAFVEVEWNPPL